MNNTIALSTAAACLAASTLFAFAQDGKAELLDAWRSDGFLKARSAAIAERCIDFKMSPKWYAKFVAETDARNTLSNLASSLYTVGDHLGLGKVDELDGDRDQKSPLFTGMLDEWKSKLHMTIVLPELDAAGNQKVLDKLAYVVAPIESWAKPRSGKYFLTITMDPKARAFSYKHDKERVNYTLVWPVYVDASQSALDEAVRKGN